MAWVLYLFSSSLSVFSAFVMGYLALKAEIAPWVAPIISVVIILILLQLVSGDWFKKMAIAAISAGSIGGMIGMCLAWTSAYFLHQIEFANWISSPFKFAGTISFFVLIAGALAFLIAIPLYFSLVVPGRLKFPMSRLVYEVIYAKNKLMMFGKVIIGLISSMVYNFLLYFSHVPLNAYLPQLQIAPVFLAIGFISGQAIVIPILMGLLLRFFTATIIRDYYFYFDMKHDFIFAFASGMLIAVFVIELLLFVWLAIFSKNENKIDMEKFKKIFNFSDYKLYKFFFVVTILLGMLFFAHWNLSALQQIYVFLLIFFIGNGIAKIVGRIGIVDITSFVALIIMPYTYFFYSSTLSMLIISSFSAISLGVLTALLFSFKVGELAKIKYENMFKYLIASFVVVSALSGVIFYINKIQWSQKKRDIE